VRLSLFVWELTYCTGCTGVCIYVGVEVCSTVGTLTIGYFNYWATTYWVWMVYFSVVFCYFFGVFLWVFTLVWTWFDEFEEVKVIFVFNKS
jgi:hypothetical protein